MADWYVSSAAYAGYTAFQGAHNYSIGDIIVPTAPALKAKWVLRCTTAGLSTTEPTWATANNGTSTSGTAVFTNVTGQSTFFWTAAAGDLPTLLAAVGANRFAAGDRMFVSSDHAETQTAASATTYGATTGSSYSGGQVLSVNRAGSTPPVAADLLAGATCTQSGAAAIIIASLFPVYHYGISYIISAASNSVVFGSSTTDKVIYLDTCVLSISNASNSTGRFTSNSPCSVVLSNTTLSTANIANAISASSSGALEWTWTNTSSAVGGGAVPTQLLTAAGSAPTIATLRGVDLSAVTTNLVTNANTACKYLFDSCKIASGVTRYLRTSVVNTADVVELVNCYDGTNILSERYTPAGTLTTETTITLSAGASDNVGAYSHKLVSTANIDKFANTFDGFWMDVNNTVIGSSKTATVEIISSASLNNDEISLWLEYEGTTTSSFASFVNSFIATPLTTPSAVTSSSATWNSSPATPVTQKLQVTFTPRTAGSVRGIVRLGKASTTVYINPQITVT